MNPRRILGVLNGPDIADDLLKVWLDWSDYVIAADGGGDSLLGVGKIPDVLIGDLDSLQGDLAEFGLTVQDDDQNFTDTDKLLRYLADQGTEEVTLIGVEGGLPDHALGILQSAAKSLLSVRLIFGSGWGWVLTGPCQMAVPALGRVSFIPLDLCEGVSISGVKWPVRNATFEPAGANSLSNQAEASSEAVSVTLDGGHAFLFVQRNPEPD